MKALPSSVVPSLEEWFHPFGPAACSGFFSSLLSPSSSSLTLKRGRPSILSSQCCSPLGMSNEYMVGRSPSKRSCRCSWGCRDSESYQCNFFFSCCQCKCSFWLNVCIVFCIMTGLWIVTVMCDLLEGYPTATIVIQGLISMVVLVVVI